MDVLDCKTDKKSRDGVDMPLWIPGSKQVLTHKADEDDQPREMFLTLLGPESEHTRRAMASAQNRASRRKENHTESDDEIEATNWADSKMMAKLTVGGLVFWDGEWVEIDSSNAAKLYFEVPPFRTQAFAFVLDPGNYIQG